MPEDTPSPASSQTPQPAAPQPPVTQPQTPFDIGEEYGTAKKNLPPIKIVLLAIAVVGIVSAIMIFIQRPHSAATGSVSEVVAVEVPGQNITMVAIKAELDANSGHFPDDAASAVDFERYFAAFPALKEHALPPLAPETRIDPGAAASGTVIVSFPVTAQEFADRKSLVVTVQPYEGAALVMSK
jgi:hypothetical protein